jgi:predicted flap endonuclease-1-like 5' DNA nuclease
MEVLAPDSRFFWLVWGVFVLSGVVIGWLLRAVFSERFVRKELARTLHEKHTVGRLYTHLKQQHDFREADIRRLEVELNNLHAVAGQMETDLSDRKELALSLRDRLGMAEEALAVSKERIRVLEAGNEAFGSENEQLHLALLDKEAEVAAWGALQSEFSQLRKNLVVLDALANGLELERANLQRALDLAHAEIERSQVEYLRYRKAPKLKKTAGSSPGRKGGPSIPEQKDDLKVIRGITPILEQQLHGLGVYTFDQISKWDDAVTVSMAASLGVSPGKIFLEDWMGQALMLGGNQA